MRVLERPWKILIPLCILVEKHINVPGLFALWVESLSNHISKFVPGVKELNNAWVFKQRCCFISTALVVCLQHVCPNNNYANVLIFCFFKNRFLNGFGSLQAPTASRG